MWFSVLFGFYMPMLLYFYILVSALLPLKTLEKLISIEWWDYYNMYGKNSNQWLLEHCKIFEAGIRTSCVFVMPRIMVHRSWLGLLGTNIKDTTPINLCPKMNGCNYWFKAFYPIKNEVEKKPNEQSKQKQRKISMQFKNFVKS